MVFVLALDKSTLYAMLASVVWIVVITAVSFLMRRIPRNAKIQAEFAARRRRELSLAKQQR